MTYLLRLTPEHAAVMEPERFELDDIATADVCPNDWKVRGYVRASHSVFHPLHECQRQRGHSGRCRCFCGRERMFDPSDEAAP